MKYLVHVACPLYELMKKDAMFVYTEEFQHSFETFKKMLTRVPIIISLDWSKIFHVYTNTLDRVLGGTLMQEKAIGYL